MPKLCPLIQKECLTHGCEFYIHLIGMNPQTGKEMDDFNCAVKFLPILMIEGANQTRMASASVDKVANEVRRQSETIFGLASPEAKARLLNADPSMKQIEGKGA